MSRPRSTANGCSRRLAPLRPIGVGWLLLAWSVTLLATSVSAAGPSVAVAPFENEDATWAVARAISDRLAEASFDRLLPPGSFVADPIFEPSPEAVRRMAFQAAVENVLVGRVLPSGNPRQGERRPRSRRVEIALHSGHSGAEVARHDVLVEGPRAIGAAAETLAAAILRDLGEGEPGSMSGSESAAATSAPAAASGTDEGDSGGSSGRGLDAAFDFAGFSGDAPIEIKAEEAEIVNRNGGRELIFQRNVFVRQANVTLRSDRLEATYDKGESEPRKLVAKGKVFVDQGDRQARCDRAVFLRDTQQLTCVGHAELIQGCDVVRGDSIRFDLARDRARVEGAASIVIRPDDTPIEECVEGGGVL